ncbi:MAG TPA: dTDP-4-dehydrorhamnose reductase [Casimicrobiaceae bacterium]|nr:dTDP-4-dehydrorhamnose reductase [Casimicrobiaceae bacterium]
MTGQRPTILLTGARGQLGRELAFALRGVGDVVACDRATLDLGDADRIVDVVRRSRPHVIVNAGAYTAVDRAERERDRAFVVNADAPRVLAEEAKRANAILVHYSTDYVFDGAATTPYDESAPPHPLNVYGESKLAGELAIAASGASSIVLRTSWVYGREGQNFLVTMQKLAASRTEINVVDDQIGVPNWTRWLADTTAAILGRDRTWLADRTGLYHLCALGRASWYDFAHEILRDRADVRVTPIPTSQYPTPARRPAYGVLDAARFARTFGIGLPDWQTLLHECLRSEAEPAADRSVH